MERTKIILDCDPGHDDAIAILLAGRDPRIELLGITVVAGNQTLDRTAINAMQVCQYLGIDVPVYAGCDRPMVRDKLTAGDIHGSTGLDGPDFAPLDRKLEPMHAVNYLVKTLMESDGNITLVPTGPLTNIAMAMRMEPRIVPKIKRIVLMGGSYSYGNVSPAAEFNIMADGDAAHVVFSCGCPITMVGLDVTRKVLCVPTIVDRMAKIDTPAGHLFVDLMRFFNRTQKEVFGWEGGPLHDPVTVASILDPQLLTTKPMHVEIEHRSIQSYGRTNADVFGYLHLEPNVDVATDLDVDRFWDIVEAGIRNYA